MTQQPPQNTNPDEKVHAVEHISKSNVSKTEGFWAFFDVQMSKKWTLTNLTNLTNTANLANLNNTTQFNYLNLLTS